MKFLASAVALVAFAVASTRAGGADRVAEICKPGSVAVVNATHIAGIPVVHTTCELKDPAPPQTRDESTSLTKKSGYDLCGAPCTTYCQSGSGGPNPNDCSTLANEYVNDGTFTVSPGYYESWSYASCWVGMSNYYGSDLVYCYDSNNWAGVVNYLAWNCQGTTGDNGGQCDFYNDPYGFGYVIVGTA